MPTENNQCSECGAPISARAITCSDACRKRRSNANLKRNLIAETLGTEQEAADILAAAEGLSYTEVLTLMQAFSNLANKPGGRYSRTERELFHSVARLLARLRDLQEKHAKRLKRADRQARLLKNSTTNADLRAEFDSLVNN